MSDAVERQKLHFDRIAADYHRARQHENHRLLKRLIWSDFLARQRAELARPGLRVLEAMCGFADGEAILTSVLGRAVDYTGFDYSDAVVDKMKALAPGLKLFRQDVTSFVPDRTYDLVMCLGGLHHVPQAAHRAVRNLAAALEPGGLLLSIEPTAGNPLFAWLREAIYRRNPLFDAETERGFSVAELRSLFEGAGLRCEDICYPGLLSYVLYYNPDAFPGLNRGGLSLVRALYAAERPFLRTALARWLSFATLSVWRKP
jgi:SAM-dependent methyltransferase